MKLLGKCAAVAALVGCGEDSMTPPLDEPLGTEVTVMMLDAAGAPIAPDPETTPLAVYQDGDGFWQPLQRTEEGYLARITEERYGVAIGCLEEAPPAEPAGADAERASSLRIVHATTAERTLVALAACPRASEGARVTMAVTASGIGEEESAALHAGADRFGLPEDGDYALPVAPATREVLATVGSTEPLGHGLSRYTVRRVLRVRDVVPEDEPALALDFAAGVAPLRHPVVMRGSPVRGVITSSLHTPTARYELGRQLDELVLAPPAQAAEAELPRLQFSTGYASPEQSLAYYPTEDELEAPEALQLSLGPAFAPQPPLLLGERYLRPVFLFFPVGATLEGEERTAEYFLRLADEDAHRSYHIALSEGWVNDSSPLAYKLPDLTRLPGWSDALAIAGTAKPTWRMARVEQSTEQRVAGRLVRGSSVIGTCDASGCRTEIPTPQLVDSVELIERPARPVTNAVR